MSTGHPQILFPSLAMLVLAGGLVSCVKPFEVNVNTPAPIKVDLSMDVNVYQHGIVEKKEAEAAADFRTAMDSRRNRMSEIQELKNNRLVGEGRSGLLSIRNRPAGEYGDYVEKTIEAENLDREALMRHEATEKSVDLAKIREEQWHHWQRKSFPGEWIEVANDDGTTYRWEQKQGAAEE
jgi:Ni,Fe-hydrogenase I large subunit